MSRSAAPAVLRTIALLSLAACAQGDARPDTAAVDTAAGAASASVDADQPAATTVATTVATETAADPSRAPNEMGRIPVLEYHLIVPEEKGEFTRTPQQLQRDLEELHRRGYRPVNMVMCSTRRSSSCRAASRPSCSCSTTPRPRSSATWSRAASS